MANRTIYRSADTGRFISKNYAKKHPKTTFRQSIKLGKPMAKKRK